MRLALLLLLLAAPPLAAQDTIPAQPAPDSLSAAQMRQRAGYAADHLDNITREATAALERLCAFMSQRRAPIFDTQMPAPADSGWAYIRVCIPGQGMARESVWVRPKP